VVAWNKRLLVAIDVDGTLLDTEFEDRLRRREIDALDAVRSAGHVVALCTGRNSRSVEGLLRTSRWHPPELPLVLLNGAVVRGGEPFRVLAERVLDGETVRRLVVLFRDHDALPMVYASDANGGLLHHERRATNDILSRYLHLRRQSVGAIVAVDDLLAHLPPQALEVGTIDRKELVTELTAAIRRELDQQVRVINTQSLLGGGIYYWAEVYDRGCDKGAGVKQLAAEYEIAPERIVAIGDNYNDLDLFAAARWRVAMANGPSEVRAAAERIAPGVRESGAAQVLEEIAAGDYPPPDERL